MNYRILLKIFNISRINSQRIFEVKDPGESQYYLGPEINQRPGLVSIIKSSYNR